MMSEKKPIEEYELYDHGDGNGWQICSKCPPRWGVITTSAVTHHEGMIVIDIERYYHGMLSTTDNDRFVLTPEEAEDLANQLKSYAELGWSHAIEKRKVATT